MNRDQLLDRYTRLLQWINTTPVDESALSSLVAPDIVVPLPYPGATPDYAGLITTTTKVHESQAGWKMELVHATVDDVQCVVIGLLKVSGVHVGYASQTRLALIVVSGSGFLEQIRAMKSKDLCQRGY